MITRDEVAKENSWDVEALFSDFASWEKELQESLESKETPHWPTIASYQGKIEESAQVLCDLLTRYFAISRKLDKLYTFAHLKHDEDIAATEAKEAEQKIRAIANFFAQETAWIEPEILALSEEKIAEYLESSLLAPFKHYLQSCTKLKKHTLSSDQEKLLALAALPLANSYKTFNALSDADLAFGTAVDSAGKEHALSHGSYSLLLRSKDRLLRKNAFEAFNGAYGSYQNTFGEILAGNVQAHLFEARARNYESCLAAALSPNHVPTEVYRKLVDAVSERLPSLHRYAALRREILGVDELHLYDMYAPLVPQAEVSMSFEQAVSAVVESVAPLGSSYQEVLAEGLNRKRWVDRYENKNKRSGAYSSGCFDSQPYILMNYQGILNDVYTLAHEAGHSMHSHLSRSSQPYHYSDYTIFVAEVASTFNEQLLTDVLRTRLTTKEQQLSLITHQLEEIRCTLFRQTMFAEFELRIHELAEKGRPLTPQKFTEEYKALNEKYFGKDVVIDPVGMHEWSRIPHFYYNFYVYQYATGISAAIALYKKVLVEGGTARDAYLQFLSRGSSDYPIELLKGAGVDMREAAPIHSAIDKFDELLIELSELSSSTNKLANS